MWFRTGWKRRVDPGARARLLSEPPPPESAAVPYESRLPINEVLLGTISHLVFTVLIVVMVASQVGLSAGPLEVFLFTAGIFAAVSGVVLGGGLNPQLRIRISDEEVRVDRLFGSINIPWWQVRVVGVAPDLSRVRVEGASDARVDVSRWEEAARGQLVNALRARLPAGVPFPEWNASRVSRGALASALSVLGSASLVGSFLLAPQGGVLGVRCSGPSAYLASRFDVPRQPGCVFIRVSGPTKRAGIRVGDQMVALDGTPVTSGPNFNYRFERHQGSTFRFTVVRAVTRQTEEVTVSFGRSNGFDAPDEEPITHFLAAKSDVGQHPEYGIREYSRAIELAPDFDLAYVGRGELEENSGDPISAMNDYRKAIELDPNQAEALRDLASLLAARSSYDEAHRFVIEAVASDRCDLTTYGRNPDCSADYGILADVVLRLGDPQRAIDRALDAIAYDDESGPPHATLASAYAQLGDLERSQAELDLYRASSNADPATVSGLETAIAVVATRTATTRRGP